MYNIQGDGWFNCHPVLLRRIKRMIPSDPMILLSYVNLKLRDEFSSLEDMCDRLDVDKQEIIDKLASINYKYNPDQNQFK